MIQSGLVVVSTLQFLLKMTMLSFVIVSAILAQNFIFCEDRTLHRTSVKVGIIVPLERRHVETQVQLVIDVFNSESVFLHIEPIFIYTSERDTLLR